MRYFITVLLASCGLTFGERVEWIGNGTITGLSGVFEGEGMAVDDDVSITFSYDDDAGFDTTKDIPPPFTERERDYYDEINLTMTVVIGGRTWEGSVVSGISGIPATIFVRTGAFSERFNPLIREEELAEFSSFPQDAGMGDNTIGMNFNGTAPIFLQSGIEVDSINPLHITSATGSITTGGSANTLAFSLEISSLKVRTPVEVPDDVPLVLSIEAEETAVILSWQTEGGVTYQLQEGSGLEENDWTTVVTVLGNGEAVTRSLVKPTGTHFYRLIKE
ncbi:hypothetical protein N9165_00605 [Akkermansiaceae bacterium]|nr:hypothetical protein [Akkermansiaceae bacterium]